jgi:hypothetical protein
MSKKYLLVICLFFVITITGCTKQSVNNGSEQSSVQKCDDERKIDFVLPVTEILSVEIDTNGGILQGKDSSGQWVIINIPAGAVKQKTKIDLTFEKSTYQVRAGIKSPFIFKITPDIFFEQSISITVLYEKKYSCNKITVVVPYLVEEDNALRPAQLTGLYKNQNIFTMDTFHGGTYSWVYVE